MSQDTTTTFFNRVLPVPPVGNANAYISIYFSARFDDGRTGLVGRAAENVEGLVREVHRAQKWGRTTGDVWFCMSSQRMAEVKQTANGYSFLKAQRAQSHAVELRSLVIDLDVKEDAYASTRDALAALQKFLQDAGLPRCTLLVASGTGGVHVYWCLDTALSPARWQPLANALAEATRRHGLICDTQCTVDAARIMRVPATVNTKLGDQRPVQMLGTPAADDVPLATMQAALAPYMSQMKQGPMGVVGPAENDELTAGLDLLEAQPVRLQTVADAGCGFIKEALETGGASFSNPLWNLTTYISVFAENGREMAHKMAEGHPEYDHNETDALFERKRKEQEIKSMGWPSCQSVQNAGCGHCATCPFFKHGKTPLHLGKRSPTPAALQASDLPTGWIRRPDNTIARLQHSLDGGVTEQQLCPYPIYDGWIDASSWTLNFTTMEHGRERRISLGPEVHASKEKFLRALNMQGFSIGQDDYQNVGRFFMAWLQTLKTNRAKVVSGLPYGWVFDKNRIEGFAYGGRIWSPNAYDRPAPLPDPVIQIKYEPTGDLDVWKEAARLITDQRRPGLDMIIAMSFGSPLMRFTGESGAVLSAFSTESGIGKSTAVKVAQAVWGSPKAVMQLNNTDNAVGGNLTTLRNLPVYWDELKSPDRARFVNMIFQVSQGQGKARMRADATLRDPGQWNTLMMVASNDSLIDAATNNFQTSPAEFYRIFEWYVDTRKFGSTGDASRLVASLEQNFGQAGLVYARFLGENHEQVARDMKRIHNELSSKFVEQTGERLWFAAAASLLCGAIYANKLNLTDIDLKGLAKHIQTTLYTLREYRKSSATDMSTVEGPASIINRYLIERRARNLLVTDVLATGVGRPRGTKILSDVTRLEAVMVHISRTNHVMRISSLDFRQWLRERSISPTAVLEGMKAHYHMQMHQRVLGIGTAYAGGREAVFELSIRGTSLESWAGESMRDMAQSTA